MIFFITSGPVCLGKAEQFVERIQTADLIPTKIAIFLIFCICRFDLL